MDARKTVLIIDDDHFIREAIGEILELEGFKVWHAENGKVALEILARGKKPAVVLLDLRMPVMNGHEFLKIVQQDEELSPIPVVAISANIESYEMKGVRSFLPKPINLDELLKQTHEYSGVPPR